MIDSQDFKFEPTEIPGVFYIIHVASGLALTVPPNAKQGTNPIIREKELYNQLNLWRFVTSGDRMNSMIQNYSESNGGLVLDTKDGNSPNQEIHMWTRGDNDNQKFYILSTK